VGAAAVVAGVLAQVEEFFDTVTEFESLLVRSGLALRKYYVDISKDEQKRRPARFWVPHALHITRAS